MGTGYGDGRQRNMCELQCPVELLACCCCRAASSGVGGESSSQHSCHECQIAEGHRAGTVVECWFIPDDSIWLHGWQARYASKWSHAGSTDRSPTRFILADDFRENSWSIGALVHTYVDTRLIHTCVDTRLIHTCVDALVSHTFVHKEMNTWKVFTNQVK